MGRIADRTSGVNTGETRVGPRVSFVTPKLHDARGDLTRRAHALRSRVKRRNFNASCQRALGGYRHSPAVRPDDRRNLVERDFGTIDRARFTRGWLGVFNDFPRQGVAIRTM